MTDYELEIRRVLGLMQWVVYIQGALVALALINVVVGAAVFLSPEPSWLALFGIIIDSGAIAGTTWLASRYQSRLRREVDELIYEWRLATSSPYQGIEHGPSA